MPHLRSLTTRDFPRLLHDDSASSVIMIHDGEDALLVDASLCLSAFKTSLWLRESKSLVMALGYLEPYPVGRLSLQCLSCIPERAS